MIKDNRSTNVKIGLIMTVLLVLSLVLPYYIVPPVLVVWLARMKAKQGTTVVLQLTLLERWKTLFWVLLIWSIAGKAVVSSLNSMGFNAENNISVGVFILVTWVAYIAIAGWFSILSFRIAPGLGRVKWAWVVSSVLSWLHLYATVAFGVCGWKAIRQNQGKAGGVPNSSAY